MNFVYDPKIAAQIAAYVELRAARQGHAGGAREDRSGDRRRTRSIFPTDEMLAKVHQFDSARRSTTRTTSSSGRRSSGRRPVPGPCADLSPPPQGAHAATCSCCRASLWLALFFLVPLGFLGYQSLQSGSFDTGYIVRLGVLELLGRDLDLPRAVRPLVRLRRASRRCSRSLVAYPLVYWIAFRGGPLEERLPDPDRRAALRHVPRADARVAQHPRRRGAGRRHPARRPRPRPGRAAARDRRSPSSRGSPTTSCPSWRCRSTCRWSRSTRGCSRRPRISTRASARRSCA